jgi:hypothetical protein
MYRFLNLTISQYPRVYWPFEPDAQFLLFIAYDSASSLSPSPFGMGAAGQLPRICHPRHLRIDGSFPVLSRTGSES